jgi:hypothetical protein
VYSYLFFTFEDWILPEPSQHHEGITTVQGLTQDALAETLTIVVGSVENVMPRSTAAWIP